MDPDQDDPDTDDLGPLEPDPSPSRNRGGAYYLPPDPDDPEAFPARVDSETELG